jgi:ABC-type glycerol-3-phosphate transport system substrate-binding protein
MDLSLQLHNMQHPGRATAYGSIADLLNGKVAMHWDEFRPIQAFPTSGARPEDIGISKPPRDVAQSTPVFAAGLSIASSTPNPDLAWKFVEFLLRPDQLLAYNKAFGRNVPRRSLLSHPYFNQERFARENLQLLAEFGRPWVRTDANWMDLQNRLLAEMNKAFAMQSTPKQAMEDTAQYWNTALAAATSGK